MANIESDIDALTHKITLYLSEIVDLRSKVNYFKKENEKLLAENLMLKEQHDLGEPLKSTNRKEDYLETNKEKDNKGGEDQEDKFPWESEQPLPPMIDDYFSETPFPEAENKPTWESKKAGKDNTKERKERTEEKKEWKKADKPNDPDTPKDEDKHTKVSPDEELDNLGASIDFERDENNLDADENKPPAPPDDSEDKRKEEE